MANWRENAKKGLKVGVSNAPASAGSSAQKTSAGTGKTVSAGASSGDWKSNAKKGLDAMGYAPKQKTAEAGASSGRSATFWDVTVNSVKKGYVESLYGQESYKAMLGLKNNKAYYENLLKSEDYSFIPDNKIEEWVSGALGLFGQQLKQWTDPRALAAGTAAAGTAAIAGQIGPQVIIPEEVITAPAAFLIGIQAGSTMSNFEIEAGHAYNEMIENGISHKTAAAIATGVGAGNAALESIQLDELVKGFKAIKGLKNADGFLKKLADYLKTRGESVAKETAQEFLQESVTLAGVDLARGIENKDAVYEWKEVGKRLGGTVVSSAMSFALLGTGGDVASYTVNKASDLIAGKKGKTAADAVTETGDSERPGSDDIQPISPIQPTAHTNNEGTGSATSVESSEGTTASVKSVSVGDTFVNTKDGSTIKVLSRDDANTVIERVNGDTVERKTFTNEQADIITSNEQYKPVSVSENAPAATSTGAENTSVTAENGPVSGVNTENMHDTEQKASATDARIAAEQMLKNNLADEKLIGDGYTSAPTKLKAKLESKGAGMVEASTQFDEKYYIQKKTNGKYVAMVEGEGSGGFVANELNKECDSFEEAYTSCWEYIFNRNPDLYSQSIKGYLADAGVTATSDTKNQSVTAENTRADTESESAFKQSDDGKIRFNQTDIDYKKKTMRKGQFRVRGEGASAQTVNGYIRGKYGIYKKGSSKNYTVSLLNSGLDIGQFKTLAEAKKAATFFDDNLATIDLTYKASNDGAYTLAVTPELKAYMGALKMALDNKTYEGYNGGEATEVKAEAETKAETETKAESTVEEPSVVEETEETVESKEAAPVETEETTTANVDETVKAEETAPVETTAENTAEATVETEAVKKPKTTTKTAAKDKKSNAADKKAKGSKTTERKPADVPKGKILTLKHTKNVFSIFKKAERVARGKDFITNAYVAIPHTEENLAGVREAITSGGRYPDSLMSVVDKKLADHIPENCDIVISGDPKVNEYTSNRGKFTDYIFEIGGVKYSFDANFFNLFNDGKNTFYVSHDPKKACVVRDENGDFVALIMPKLTQISDKDYNLLPYVSEKIAERKAKRSGNADDKYSLSSMGASFFGDEDITAEEFQEMLEDGSYKEYQGYKDYVENVTNVYKQSRGLDTLSEEDVAEIERQIEGIINIGIAAAKAGYNIFDDGSKRDVKDSKKRLLFSSLEPNSDYITSSDISAICDKRKNFAEIYDDIVRLEEERGVPVDERFFSNVDNYFILHKLMAEKGLTVPCEECYVESMRKNLAPMAKAFIELVTETDDNNKANGQLYNQEGKDKGKIKKNNAKIRTQVRKLYSATGTEVAEGKTSITVDSLTMQMLTTADGLAQLKLQAPRLYETFNSFYGQSKPKMPRAATPFRPGELIALLTDSKGNIKKGLVDKIKSTGGFRLQSYSDFQIENYVDVIQTIFEASMLGLNGHAYTKVPAFLDATKGTNLKRNLSIFMYEDDGKWVLDKKNSFPKELDEIYALVAEDKSGNTSVIAVSQNANMSAWIMANDLVGFGIPFHKSGLKMDVVRARVVKTEDGREVLGYANQKDHTAQQSEVYKRDLGEKKKANTKVKNPINIYSFWDFENKDNLPKKKLIEKNLKRYIDECEKREYRPKFREYLMDNSEVLDTVLRYAKELGFVSQDATVDDISFKHGEYTIPYGYYKFLGDFGMFKPDGTAAPIEALSLENYDFDGAVKYFENAETLRTNELLQQFENGKVREEYRKKVESGELTNEQLKDILKEKRSAVAREVVDGKDDGRRASIAIDDDFSIDDDIWLEDFSMDDLASLSDEKFEKLYTALGLDKIVFDEITDDDIGETYGGEFTIEDISEELDAEPEKIEILIRRSGLGKSHVEAENSAVMSTERLNRSIAYSGAGNTTYATHYITRISPKDFIDLTVIQDHIDREAFDTEVRGDHDGTMRTYDYSNTLKTSSESPKLIIDRATGRVKDHNGRHRLRALEMAGVESVEIEVQFYDEDGHILKYGAETIPDMAISSQFDTAIETHISNIIPLNESHRAEIEKSYGEKAHADAKMKYSISENTAERKDARDAEYLELAKDPVKNETRLREMVEEAAREAGYNSPKLYHGTPLKMMSASRYKLSEIEYAELGEKYDDKIFPFVVFNTESNFTGLTYTATNKKAAENFAYPKPGTVFGLYGRFKNPLVVDEHFYDSIPFYYAIPTPTVMKEAGYTQETVGTEEIAHWAKKNNYDGVIIRGLREGPGIDTDDYIVFSSSQLKSADPVTYDNEGNIIPLSERFNTENDDLRYSTESEDTNNEREDLLPGDSRRGRNESTREQTGSVSRFKRENKGKTKAERKRFAKELLEQGQTEEVIDGRDKYNLVKPEAYNDEMQDMVEYAASMGKELGFFVGRAKMKFDTKGQFLVDGIKVSDNKILIQYDGIRPPQKLLKHEVVHTEWDSPEMQDVRDTIIGDLSEEEKEDILSQDRYVKYMELYDGDEDLVWEEFVADTLAGMNDYTERFIDTVVEYWYGEEDIDNFDASQYTNTIDTGGENRRYDIDSDGKFYLPDYLLTDGELTDDEWSEFYNSLGALKRGMWFPKTPDGDYIFETDDKLIFTDGDYQRPQINSVVVFEGLDADEIEYGKETVWNAAEGGKSCEECCEIAQAMLGKGAVTATNPYTGRTYRKGKNHRGKRGYSIEADRGTEPGVNYSLADDGIPDLFDMWDEATRAEIEESVENEWRSDIKAPATDKGSNGRVRSSKPMAAPVNPVENEWVDEDATTSTAPEDVPSLSELIKDISDSFGVTVKSGKVMIRDASGIYKETPEVIRTRKSNKLPTIIHELGHHINKKYGIEKSAHIKEAEPLLNIDVSKYSAAELPGEMAAEFVRRYFKNPEAIAKKCPNLTKDFLAALNKQDAKSVSRIAPMVNAYFSAEAGDRYASTIVDSKKAKRLSATDLEGWAHELYTKWVDGFHPIKQLVDFVEESTGAALTGIKNAYKLATNSLNAHTISNFVLLEKFRDLKGNIVSGKESFVECVKDVDLTKGKTRVEFSEYLKLKHSLEVQAKGKDVFADEVLADSKNITSRINELEKQHPEFKNAAKKLYQFQYNVLTEYAVASGLMTQEQADFLHKEYPCYVPFFRYVEGKGLFSRARRAFANQKSPIKAMKGSGLDTLDPLESIVSNTERIISAAMKHQVADVIGQYADTVEGAGAFIERIPPDQVAKNVDITALKNKFTDELQNIVNTSNDYFAISDLLDDVFGDVVTGFDPVVNEHKGIIAVQRGDDRAYYQVHDKALLESITELSPKQASGLMRFLSNTMGKTNALITQFNPRFSVFNPFRDIKTAYKLGEVDNPVKFIGAYAKALGLIIADSDSYKQYKAMGGGHSSSIRAELGGIAKSIKDLKMKDAGLARRLAYSIFRHPIQSLTSFADFTESVPRFMTFMDSYNKTGDLQEAMFQADDITTNFKRRGSGTTAKAFNGVFRFNNAAIQGLDKTRRTFSDADTKRRVQVTAKWLTESILLALVLNFFNREEDEEGYENLSSYVKNNFYNIALGDGEFISLPKERENGVLNAFIERTIDKLCGEDDAFYDFGGYLASMLLPPMLPDSINPMDAAHDMLNSTIIGPITDIGWNEDFKGTPIESDYEKDKVSSERYNESTSKLAYELGRTKFAVDNDLSPKKIDHLLSSLGVIGIVNDALFPMNESRRDFTLGLRNSFIKDSNYSTDIINKIYGNRDLAKRDFEYQISVEEATIDKAIEYEQNAIVTDYVSGMNKAIKALPEDEQRKGRAYLVQQLNRWNYDNTSSQQDMLKRLDGETLADDDCIITDVPEPVLSWSETKKDSLGRSIKGSDGKSIKVKYDYQMTPQEYHEYVTDYLKLVDKYRLYQGKSASDTEAYLTALSATKTEVKKVLNKTYQTKFKSKAKKIEQ